MKKKVHGADVTRFLNSRYWLTANIVAFIAVLSALPAILPAIDLSAGPLGLKPPSAWIQSPSLDEIAGISATIAIAATLYLINTTYNVIRSLSLIYASVFITAMMVMPDITKGLDSPLVLALAVLASLLPMFSTYQSPNSTRRIFLTFAIVSAAMALTCQLSAWIALTLVLLAAMAQMRILGLRSIMAAFIGLVTPLWIMWGFGQTESLTLMPPTSFTLTTWPTWLTPVSATCVGTTILLWLILSSANLLRIYNYNARLRAYNGVFTLLGLAMLLLMAIDFGNVPLYMPLMAACLGLQAGHFFTINHGPRSWIGIIALSTPYWALIVWQYMS